MNKKLFQKCHQLVLRKTYSYKSVWRPSNAMPRKHQITSSAEANLQEAKNLSKQIRARILTTGPITVADYMREVLTNPHGGYYMNRDVFGREGDFITSPEISQIFGELVAVWLLSEWRKIGEPKPFQLVELGPGRGTLARDVLKVLAQFRLSNQFSMHLVEISPYLSIAQAHRLCVEHEQIAEESSPYYQQGETAMGTKVFWYRRLEDVPHEFSFVLAHEFFDALPVHKMQRHEDVWKEVLIDVDDSAQRNENFRYVLSKSATPMSTLFKPIAGDVRDCLEWSPESDKIVSMLAERFERDGGIGLIMDYGHLGEKTDTFRAFKKHQLHEPLVEPGTADLTADVDFHRIKHVAEQHDQVVCYGPVEQGSFIKKMEGDVRLEQLMTHALPEHRERLKSGYEMLTDVQQMGRRFKFLSMFPAVLKEHLTKYPVHGFN